ncbi:MAG: hypothetical protein ACKVRO_18700 [Micropepsaceae bacterium]
MTHNFGKPIDAFLAVSAAAGIAAVGFLVFLTAGVGQNVPVPVRPAASPNLAQVAHCSQFVELARSKFGPEWKRRLDPSDTACAQQIQAVWELDRNPREAAPAPVLRPTVSPILTKIEPQSAPQQKAMIITVTPIQPKVLANTPSPAKIVSLKAEPARAPTFSVAAVTAQTPTPPAPPTRRVNRAPTIQPPAVTKGSPALEDSYDGEQVRDERSSSRDDGADDGSEATFNNAQAGRRSRYDDEVRRPRHDYGYTYEDDDSDAYPHDEDFEDDSGDYENDNDYR